MPNANLLPYIREYFKINSLAFDFALFLLFFPLIFNRLRLASLSGRKVVLIFLFLGVLLRAFWIGTSSHEPRLDWGPQTSENDWINIHAAQMTQGIWFQDPEGLPAGRRPIGYPLFVGALYKIFGIHYPMVWASHVLLHVAAALLVYGMARLLFGETCARMALLFFSVYPTSVYSSKLIVDEHLFLPVWYLGLYGLLKEMKGGPPRWPWLGYGLVFGYAAMIRTHAIFMPAVIFIALLLKDQPWPKALRIALLTALMMQIPNLPWVIRNYQAWKIPVLYTPTGCAVYTQVNDTALESVRGGHIPLAGEPGYCAELDAALKSGNVGLSHQLCNREMKRWIVSHPRQFLFLGLRNLLVFMNWNRQGGVWPIWYQYEEGHFDPARPLPAAAKKTLEEAAFASYYILLFSFLISLAFLAASWKRLEEGSRKGLLIFGACFLFWFLEHLVIYPDRKYRYPLEPLMMIVASFFWSRLAERMGKLRFGEDRKKKLTKGYA